MNQTDIIMENDYHNPYDHRMAMKPNSSESDHQSNHYEAPSCLVRNPSGSLFIPSSGKFILLQYLFSNFHIQGTKLKGMKMKFLQSAAAEVFWFYIWQKEKNCSSKSEIFKMSRQNCNSSNHVNQLHDLFHLTRFLASENCTFLRIFAHLLIFWF